MWKLMICLLLLVLAGCGDSVESQRIREAEIQAQREAVAAARVQAQAQEREAQADIAQAQAQQAAAVAQGSVAQAQAQQSAAVMDTVAQIATVQRNTVPAHLVVWLLAVVAVPLSIILVFQGLIAYKKVSHVRDTGAMQLLPGDVGFEHELRQYGAHTGSSVGRDASGWYIVQDGKRERVRALLPTRGG